MKRMTYTSNEKQSDPKWTYGKPPTAKCIYFSHLQLCGDVGGTNICFHAKNFND